MTREGSPNTPASILWDAIGGIPVVNLNQRRQRWERMREVASGVVPDGKLERFAAVIGTEIPGFGDRPWFRGKPTDTRWAARAGCTLSHRGVLELARDKGWEIVLVMEDDADLSKTTREELHSILGYLIANPAVWDVCYLGYSKSTGPAARIDVVGEHGVYQVSGCATTHAYLVNAKARDWILGNLPDRSGIWTWLSSHRAVDRWYSRHLSRHLRVLAISPCLIPQFGGFSDIVQKEVVYDAEFPGIISPISDSPISFKASRLGWRIRGAIDSFHDLIRGFIKKYKGF